MSIAALDKLKTTTTKKVDTSGKHPVCDNEEIVEQMEEMANLKPAAKAYEATGKLIKEAIVDIHYAHYIHHTHHIPHTLRILHTPHTPHTHLAVQRQLSHTSHSTHRIPLAFHTLLVLTFVMRSLLCRGSSPRGGGS